MQGSNKVRFFGDFTTGENYQLALDIQCRVNFLRQKGYDPLIENIKGYFDGAYNIVNLESPITKCTKSGLANKKSVLHWMDPAILPQLLKNLGVDAVSLGNNHGWDYEFDGLKETIDCLDSVGIKYFGAGYNLSHARMPLKHTIEVGQKKVNLYVFGGYKYRQDYDEEFYYYAKEEKAGIFLLTSETIKGDIQQIKQEDPDAYIVIFPHFGFDASNKVDHQIEYAKEWMDTGADMVIGHGPHMLNEMDYYKDTPVLYGLGNFVFPTNFKRCVNPFGAVAELEFVEDNGSLKVIKRIYPLHVPNDTPTPVTRALNDDELEEYLEVLSGGRQEIKDRIKIHKGVVYCIEL